MSFININFMKYLSSILFLALLNSCDHRIHPAPQASQQQVKPSIYAKQSNQQITQQTIQTPLESNSSLPSSQSAKLNSSQQQKEIWAEDIEKQLDSEAQKNLENYSKNRSENRHKSETDEDVRAIGQQQKLNDKQKVLNDYLSKVAVKSPLPSKEVIKTIWKFGVENERTDIVDLFVSPQCNNPTGKNIEDCNWQRNMWEKLGKFYNAQDQVDNMTSVIRNATILNVGQPERVDETIFADLLIRFKNTRKTEKFEMQLTNSNGYWVWINNPLSTFKGIKTRTDKLQESMMNLLKNR